ncbi:MAG TPA: hypothetical protein DCS93_36745 [Microscillaceae bacterium]|nr:hypothetical protein [Microscillaceae bacterium]
MASQPKDPNYPNPPKLPRLLIDEEFKIKLIKSEGWEELKMTSLCKILYCLFLRHPEGITLYELGNYQEELMRMYQPLCWEYKNRNQFMQDRITELVCRCSNSVYEKMSRIKALLSKHLPPDLVHWYCIEGERGQAKRIALPRHWVIIKYNF